MITAQTLVNPDLPALTAQDDPVNALNLMDQFRVAHLPVVENGKFRGVISETELLSIDRIASEKENAMKLVEVSVPPEEHILEILKVASEHHLTIIPVVDVEKKYMGAITLEKLVDSLSQYQSVNDPGAIVVLEINENDYHLSQIARIVEENDARILSLSVNTSPGSGKMELHLKINKEDINPILQSFERFGYNITASYQEPEYTEDMRTRYDELMRYLNT
ncbi:MAG: CBS domain-containing protein [Flavobacteriales bacterium]|nr:CBS domain-containing protein [Flavobacteriales bacterium]